MSETLEIRTKVCSKPRRSVRGMTNTELATT